MDSKSSRTKEKIQQAISAFPVDEAEAALMEICKERASIFQAALKERDQLIQGIQLENIALKGALREGTRLLRLCVGLLQQATIQIPREIAEYLGMVPGSQGNRPSGRGRGR